MTPLSKILRPALAGIQPYNSGLSLADVQARFEIDSVAKLASNENPHGPAPEVLDCLKLQQADLYLYPDAGATLLRDALAADMGVEPGRLIFGNGSEELISIICRTVIAPGDRVITLFPSFPLHEDYAGLMDAQIERVTVTQNFEIDLDALLEAVARPAKMLIFANPMNPVGCWLRPEQLRAVIAATHPDTLVVLDEAYHEYASGGDYQSGQGMLDPEAGHWILLRTFSKAWGLAGLRIGFGLCSGVALRQALDLSRTPFNVNAVAQRAAVTALQQADHMRASVARITEAREALRRDLQDRGFAVAPSLGNFLFFRTGGDASALAEALMRHGTIVKPWKQAGFADCIRVSIGTATENAQFLRDLDRVTGRLADT